VTARTHRHPDRPYHTGMTPRPHLFEMDPETLAERCRAEGMAGYRAGQILKWLYRRQELDPAKMTDLGRADREHVGRRFLGASGVEVGRQLAQDGVQKLLLEWTEGDPTAVLGDTRRQSECVMIPDGARRTACLSSQVGCPVGCRFCASGLGGLDGNLTAGQIVEQAWRLSRLEGVGRVSHVVFMGMGEPLANFEAVTRAIRILSAAWGMGISGRRITVSTVGLPAGIRRLAEADLPAITLAISLHAPNDAIRRQLIPWARQVSVADLVAAGRDYFERTGREVTLEYILLAGVNDRPEHARELAEIARSLRSNVNLIRYNEVPGLPDRRPASADVHRFQQVLRGAGVNTHLRASRGRDIAAACGQLRHEAREAANV